MKIGTTLPSAIALGLLAVFPGCVSPREHIRTTYQASVFGKFDSGEHLAVFDVTLDPKHPPPGKTGMNIEVSSGPAAPPANLIDNPLGLGLGPWTDHPNDHAYGGHTTYYVEVAVYYLPIAPEDTPDIQTFKFEGIRNGVRVPGAPVGLH